MMNKQKLWRIFFPKRCSVCGEIIPFERDHCKCSGDVYVEAGENACEHCGLENCCCKIENTAVLPHITAAYIYSNLAKERLLDLKFHGEKKEAEFFGERMSFRFAKFFPGVDADFVTFVPMTEKSVKKRGYNQSRLLAQSVAKHLFLPLEDVLSKTRETESQRTLSQKERLLNLREAFVVRDESLVLGKTVILCDDIKTTGTTLLRCCDELFKAGAEGVYCLCAAVADFEVLTN